MRRDLRAQRDPQVSSPGTTGISGREGCTRGCDGKARLWGEESQFLPEQETPLSTPGGVKGETPKSEGGAGLVFVTSGYGSPKLSKDKQSGRSHIRTRISALEGHRGQCQ